MFVLMLRWMERGRDGAAGLIAGVCNPFTRLSIIARRLPDLDETMARGRLHDRRTRRRRRAHDRVSGHGNDSELCAGADLSDRAMETGAAGKYRYRSNSGADVLVLLRHASRNRTSMGGEELPSLAAELALLAFTIKVTVSRPRDDDPDGRLFILWIMTAILISPTSWFYYLVLLTIPMVKLSAAAANNRTSARALWAGVACYTLAWLYFTLVDMHSTNARVASGCAGLAAWSFAGGAARLSLALLVRVRFRFSRSGVDATARCAIGRFGSAALLRCSADGAHRGLTIACRLSARYGSHCGPVDDMVTGIDHAR